MLIISLVLAQVVIFGGLIFIFRRILNSNVVSATQHLDGLNQEYDKKSREVDKRLSEAKRQADEFLTKARKEGDKQKTEVIKEAEAERDKLLKHARSQSVEIIQQADKSKQAILSEIEDRIAKEAIEKACELVEAVLSGQFKLEVHSEWVDDLIENGFKQMSKLHIGSDITEAKVTSALPLEKKQRARLSQKLKTIFKKDITIREEVNPKVVAGIVITLGNLVLDGSLRDKIREKVRHAG